jgi:replicative DNA helicase
MKTNESDYHESILVGTILHHPDLFPEIASIVKARDFQTTGGKESWLKVCECFSTDNKDFYVKVIMGLTGDVRQWAMSASSETIPSPSSAERIAKKVADISKRKRLAASLKAIALKAEENGSNADWILEDMLSAYNMEMGEVEGDIRIPAVLERFNERQAKNQAKGGLGLRTGFDGFQNDYLVYQPGHLWVVGGWTSTGKSAYMIEGINRFLLENPAGKVAVFSTEMTEEQNVARILANRTGVNANVILSGQMLPNHIDRVEQEKKWLLKQNLYIHAKFRNIDDIMAQCRKLKFAGGIDLIWLDFIQNVSRPGTKSQYDMMSQIARDLQNLAHDLQCTIVCLSQLPNSAGKEDSGILEFKGAGEIAAACDVGVLMKRSTTDEKVILFDIRKNRHGKCGEYLLQFDAGWTRIIEKEV